MQEYAPYFLPALSLLILSLWAWLYRSSPSLRSRQWLVTGTLTAMPVIGISQLWWPWAVASASPANSHSFFIIIIISCFIGATTTFVRRLLQPSFNQALEFSWGRYIATVVVLVIISHMSAYLPWPRDVSAVITLAAIVGYVMVRYFSVTKLYGALMTTVLALTAILVIQSVYYMVVPSAPLWEWYVVRLGLQGWHSALVVLLCVAWPSMLSWWTNQSEL